MAYLQYLAGFVFVTCLCIHQGYALKCFECNSHNDTRCSQEPVDPELIITCPEKHNNGKPYILCRKIKQVIEFEVNGLPQDSRIIRGCGWDDTTYKNRCYHRSGFGGRQEVCACEEDKCNRSNTIWASIVLLVASYTTLNRIL